MTDNPDLNSEITFKRKFRWMFNATFKNLEIPECLAKMADRPTVSIYNLYKPIRVSYFDVIGQTWVGPMLDYIIAKAKHPMSGSSDDLIGHGELTMYNAAGEPIEQWQFGSLEPVAMDFGTVDYAASEECQIVVTYQFFELQYLHNFLKSDATENTTTTGDITGTNSV